MTFTVHEYFGNSQIDAEPFFGMATDFVLISRPDPIGDQHDV